MPDLNNEGRLRPILNSARLGFSGPQQSRQVWRSNVSWSVRVIYTFRVFRIVRFESDEFNDVSCTVLKKPCVIRKR